MSSEESFDGDKYANRDEDDGSDEESGDEEDESDEEEDDEEGEEESSEEEGDSESSEGSGSKGSVSSAASSVGSSEYTGSSVTTPQASPVRRSRAASPGADRSGGGRSSTTAAANRRGSGVAAAGARGAGDDEVSRGALLRRASSVRMVTRRDTSTTNSGGSILRMIVSADAGGGGGASGAASGNASGDVGHDGDDEDNYDDDDMPPADLPLLGRPFSPGASQRQISRDTVSGATEPAARRSPLGTSVTPGGLRAEVVDDEDDEDEDAEYATRQETASYVLSDIEKKRLRGAFMLRAKILEMRDGTKLPYIDLTDKPDEHGGSALRNFTIVVVSLGLSLSERQLKQDFAQLKRAVKKANKNKRQRPRLFLDMTPRGNQLGEPTLKNYYISKILGNRQEEKIRSAWEGLHYGTDRKTLEGEAYIYAVELQQILTTRGEPLNDEECAEMLREVEPDLNDRIFYRQYRRMLLDKQL